MWEPSAGADASGLGFRQELDPGTKDAAPHTWWQQLGFRQGQCRARVCGEARPGLGEVSLQVCPPVGRELEGLCFLQGSACFWKGGDSMPQKPPQSRGACGFPSKSPWESSGSTAAASLHARRAALPPLESHTASEQHRSRWRYLSALATRWDLWALRDPDPLTRGASGLGRSQACWKAARVTPRRRTRDETSGLRAVFSTLLAPGWALLAGRSRQRC